MSAEICVKILIIIAVRPNDFLNSCGEAVEFLENITIVQAKKYVDVINHFT
jgi:hypothetical protein